MKEVSKSFEAEWVPVETVTNICFIFHLDVIEKGLVSCGGMERVFFVRYKRRNGKLLSLKERQFKSFFRHPEFPFQESYPEAIWSQLSVMKQLVGKEMSCGGVWDG
jgi:hypothetical protein